MSRSVVFVRYFESPSMERLRLLHLPLHNSSNARKRPVGLQKTNCYKKTKPAGSSDTISHRYE